MYIFVYPTSLTRQKKPDAIELHSGAWKDPLNPVLCMVHVSIKTTT